MHVCVHVHASKVEGKKWTNLTVFSDKIITISFAMNVFNIFYVLIYFHFFFSLLSSCPCSLPLVLLVRISQWCLHSTCCIWWQRASQWPCEPVGFPQVDWVLLVVSCLMRALLGMGDSAAGNDTVWFAKFSFSSLESFFEAESFL